MRQNPTRLQFPLRSLFPATAVVAVMLLALRLCGLSEPVAARLAAVAIGFLLTWILASAAGCLAAGWFSTGADENRKQLQGRERFENAALGLLAVFCLFGTLQLAAWLMLILYVATPEPRGNSWLRPQLASHRVRRRLSQLLGVAIAATLGCFSYLLNNSLQEIGAIVPQATEELEGWLDSTSSVIRNVAYHNAGSLALLTISLLAAARSLACHEDQAAEHRSIVATSQLAAILLTSWQSVWAVLLALDAISTSASNPYSFLAEQTACVGLWSLWSSVLVLGAIAITWSLMGSGAVKMWRDHSWMFLLGLLALLNAAAIYLCMVALLMRSANMG